MNVTIGERLRATEAVAHREPKANTSATATAMLEERVARLEETLTEGLRITSGPQNDPRRLGAVHQMGKGPTGYSYSLDSKDLGDGIKEQHRAEAETLLGKPQIYLAVLPIDDNQHRVATCHTDDRVDFISGSPESFARTMSILHSGGNTINDVGSRHFLLGSLHQKELQLHEHECYDQQRRCSQNAQYQPVGPALRFREKSGGISWGSIPTETTCPFVATTVSDIATIARRLGMSWEVFDPEGGTMRAQGNGYGIFSTSGWLNCLVLQYKLISVNDSSFTDLELYVPTREANMMGFGSLPRCHSLNIPAFKMGTTDDVYTTMDMLDSTGKASSKLRDMNSLVGKWDAHCMYGFSDIIALAAPMIRCRHSTIIRVPRPAKYCSSLLSHKECFVVFHNRLKEYVSARSVDVPSAQVDWVLEQYERLKARYSEWENEAENNNRVNDRELNFLEDVNDCWDAATDYFVQLQEKHRLRYLHLMASHISHAVNYWTDAWQRLKEGNARDNYGLWPLEAEGAHLYFDYLPLIVEDMRRKGFEGPDKLVHEAWFTLMFRAFCWWRCHSLHPGEDSRHKGSPLPSRYWDCHLPVYIR